MLLFLPKIISDDNHDFLKVPSNQYSLLGIIFNCYLNLTGKKFVGGVRAWHFSLFPSSCRYNNSGEWQLLLRGVGKDKQVDRS